MGGGSPFFPKTSVISTRFTYEKRQIQCGSKGLSPLAGVGAEPQKNFASPPLTAQRLNNNSVLPQDNNRAEQGLTARSL